MSTLVQATFDSDDRSPSPRGGDGRAYLLTTSAPPTRNTTPKRLRVPSRANRPQREAPTRSATVARNGDQTLGRTMPNLGTVLRDEISRLALRTSRGEIDPTRKATAQHRRAIALLKRQVAKLEREVSALTRKVSGNAERRLPAAASAKPVRFAAKGLRAQRERLGLSAAGLWKARRREPPVDLQLGAGIGAPPRGADCKVGGTSRTRQARSSGESETAPWYERQGPSPALIPCAPSVSIPWSALVILAWKGCPGKRRRTQKIGVTKRVGRASLRSRTSAVRSRLDATDIIRSD